jgi:DNA-binding ferritin-like protein
MEHRRSLKTQPSKGLSRPTTKTSTMERSPEMKEVDGMTAELVVEIMNAATSFHKLHLSVTGDGSYAQHKALNEIYDALPDLADTIAEGYQGACEVILNYPDKAPARLMSIEGAVEYMRTLSMQIADLQKVMPHTEVVNNLDLIKDQINSAKYKLLFLS